MKWSDDSLDRVRRLIFDEKCPASGPPQESLPAGPRTISRYRLLELLGEGGMGVVYRAQDEKLGGEVALKVLKPAISLSPVGRERFRREVRNAALLDHPGIVKLLESGSEGDLMFFTMELAKGKPFDVCCGTLENRVRILMEVCEAVHSAHECGIIHRDLKPSNILVTSEGRPRLLDFGLSRSLSGSEDLSRTGAILGTPHYMSPEQASGLVHAMDARSDVYSLGAVLYEAATGKTPHHGKELAEIVRAIIHEEPPRPSSLDPEIPRDLETIILRAISKEPSVRHATAGVLAEDLRRLLDKRPILSRRPGVLMRTARLARRKPRAFVLGASAFAFLAIMVSAGISLTGTIGKLRRDSEGERLRSEADRDSAIRMIREAGRTAYDASLKLRRKGATLDELRPFLDSMRKAYQEARASGADTAEVHYLMGRVSRVLLQDEAASQYQDLALQKNPRYGPALYDRIVLRAAAYGNELSSAYQGMDAVKGKNDRDGSLVLPLDEVERKRPDLALARQEILKDCSALEMLLTETAHSDEVIGRVHLAAAHGILLHHQGDYSKAENLLRDVVQRAPFLVEAREALCRSIRSQYLLGYRPQSEDGWAELETIYSQGIRDDRGYVPFFLGRAQTHNDRATFSQHRRLDPVPAFNAAEGDLTEALRLEPGNLMGFVMRSETRGRRGGTLASREVDPIPDWRAAEADMVHALELGPGRAVSWMTLGTIRYRRGVFVEKKGDDPLPDWTAALENFKRAIVLGPKSAKAHLKRAQVNYSLGMHQESRGEDPLERFASAATDCGNSLRVDAESIEALMLRSKAFLRIAEINGSRDEEDQARPYYLLAKSDYEQLLELRPSLKSKLSSTLVRVEKGLSRQ